MTKPTYPEQCLERAEKATEGPWKQYKTGDASWPDGIQNNLSEDIICGSIDYEQTGVSTELEMPLEGK